ncbi:hypothetical protein L1987_12344 [Smallanthus sonchifolius]|uniref:Uncharacterized protein n=1 Tax=Smallanthus sonchifolius TaxID=185202 RepID=A0ACB9JDY6_9ASTR|nr:hypothetical protein L1987_12344 [Smallanthus sonchifolius]
MAIELYSTVTLRQGEKKLYNHKVDAYSFAIVLWELVHNKMPFEGMSNLQAAYAAAFKKAIIFNQMNLTQIFHQISFEESIPFQLGRIINQDTFVLSSNHFSGAVPAYIGDLEHLLTLIMNCGKMLFIMFARPNEAYSIVSSPSWGQKRYIYVGLFDSEEDAARS